MESLLLYLLKSAALLSLFFTAYIFLLKKDTTFITIRIFLIIGIVAAFILPSLEFTRTIPSENVTSGAAFQYLHYATSDSSVAAENFNWWHLAGIIYFSGLAVLLLFFIIQSLSLIKRLLAEPGTEKDGFVLIESRENIQPFSFFRYIIYNPQLHSAQDLKMILEHEKTHARQWHSADVLLSTVVCGILWFNPVSWLYKKNVVQNLEYLTDRETVANSGSKKQYQTTLLNVSLGGLHPALSNPFYQSFIKKRIMMLNKTATSKNNVWKTATVIPFLIAFILGFQVRAEAQKTPEEKKTENSNIKERKVYIIKETTADPQEINASEHSDDRKEIMLRELQNPPLFILNGEIQGENFSAREINPEKIKNIHVLKGESAIEKYGERAKHGAVEIILKSASEENRAEKPKVTEDEKKSSIRIVEVKKPGFGPNGEPNKPLYVVDGKVMDSDFNTGTIDPAKIESINVFKGKKALEEYGEKASEGVIEITTKKAEQKN